MHKFLEKIKKAQTGISIMEISVAIGILSFALISFMTFTTMAIKSSHSSIISRQAAFHAQEMLEAVHSFRDNTDWDTDGLGTIAQGSALHPEISPTACSSEWILAAGEEIIGIYTRSLTVYPVSRSAVSGDIETVYNAANLDTGTVKITAAVNWDARSLILNSYLTNWR